MNYMIKGNVVTENNVLKNHYLHISNGKIESINEHLIPSNEIFLDMEDKYILPGFRDQHIHDINGQLDTPNLSINEISNRFDTVTQALAQKGVTGVYMATFGAALEHLVKYCQGAREWMDDPRNGKSGAKLLGINIEGTFLNEECRGAQPAEFCLIPIQDDCISAIGRLNATGAVGLINIVPDYGLPSLETIQHAANLGILTGAGHIKCSADLLRKAFEEYGLQFMVHLTNGPTGQSFKPFDGGGTFEGSMGIPITKELVLDRVHVDERYVLDIIKRTEDLWGEEKIVAVTDSSFPIPSEVPDNEFKIGTTLAKKDEKGLYCRAVAYIQPDGTTIPSPANTLCGSILSMDKAFSNLVSLFTKNLQGIWFDHPALSFDQAVIKASRLCSTNQTILDGHYIHTGSIELNKDADLVIGTFSGKNTEYEFQIEKVFVGGFPVI